MARPEEAKAVKAFKDAKTPKEMIYSWASQSPGRPMEAQWEVIKPFGEKYPWLVEYYCHRGLQNLMDRGALDRRTRELVIIGGSMVRNVPTGVAAHIANAKAWNVTEEEVVAVAECACYAVAKVMCLQALLMLKGGYEYAKSVTLYEP